MTTQSKIQLYLIPNVYGRLAAYHPETKKWEIFPGIEGGYAQRRDWTNPMMQKWIMKNPEIHRDHIAEISHSAMWLGLPPGSTQSKYETANLVSHV